MDMPSAYEDTLHRIEKAQKEDIALPVLSWIYHALRPLRLYELVEVISIRSGDTVLEPDCFVDPPEMLVEACQGLFDDSCVLAQLADRGGRTRLVLEERQGWCLPCPGRLTVG